MQNRRAFAGRGRSGPAPGHPPARCICCPAGCRPTGWRMAMCCCGPPAPCPHPNRSPGAGPDPVRSAAGARPGAQGKACRRPAPPGPDPRNRAQLCQADLRENRRDGAEQAGAADMVQRAGLRRAGLKRSVVGLHPDLWARTDKRVRALLHLVQLGPALSHEARVQPVVALPEDPAMFLGSGNRHRRSRSAHRAGTTAPRGTLPA